MDHRWGVEADGNSARDEEDQHLRQLGPALVEVGGAAAVLGRQAVHLRVGPVVLPDVRLGLLER
eukprot:scaffold658318_cov39-Prasinocladus_malaysianus.AAC.1